MGGERDRRNKASGEPLDSAPLPPELAEFLRDKDVACLMQATDQGTVFVVKLPEHEIASVRGRVLIRLTHELYDRPTAPVIRTVLRIYDQPASHLALETYTNIEDEVQRTDFASLSRQDTFVMLFYDEQLNHTLTKVVTHAAPEETTRVLDLAERLFSALPQEQFNFDKAKQEVMEATRL